MRYLRYRYLRYGTFHQDLWRIIDVTASTFEEVPVVHRYGTFKALLPSKSLLEVARSKATVRSAVESVRTSGV